MLPVLSAAACRWLRDLQGKVAAKGRVKESTQKKVVCEIISWCLEHQLLPANSQALESIFIDRALLVNIEAVQQQLGQPSFKVDVSALHRTEVALTTNIEQKTIGIAPRENRILLRLSQAMPLPNGLSAQVLDLSWQSLPLTVYDVLLIVENLDCFYQLERFKFDLAYQQPLIVYRGDKLYGKGVKALKAAWLALDKPAVYFGDFDAKGVSIAFNEGYSAMLLPEFSQLNEIAAATMLPDKQLNFINGLQRGNASPAFLPYRQLLCEQLKGLRQQNMQCGALHVVELHNFHEK